jgi:hypothetical protein
MFADSGATVGLTILVAIFLPFIVSLQGSNPVWKFLSFLFCLFSIFGAFLLLVPGVIAWVIAWIFAGVSLGSRPRQLQTFDSGPIHISKVSTGVTRPWKLSLVIGAIVLISIGILASEKNALWRSTKQETTAATTIAAAAIISPLGPDIPLPRAAPKEIRQ